MSTRQTIRRRNGNRRMAIAWSGSLIVGSALLLGGGVAFGDTYSWNVDNGEFTNPASWNPAGPPGAADLAYFNRASAGNVTLAQSVTNAALQITQGNVLLDLKGNTYTLTNGSGYAINGFGGVLVVTNGTVVDNGKLYFGEGSPATLTIGQAAVLQYNGPWDGFVFGGQQSCTLNVTNGGQVLAPGAYFYLGMSYGCDLNVSGPSSVVSNYGLSALNAGGNINITGGGKVETVDMTLGGNANGTTTVSGTNSLLRQTGATDCLIGYGALGGNNTLIISNKANVEVNGKCYVGCYDYGYANVGHVIVDNATMTNKKVFYIGFNGGRACTSSMTIAHGGLVYVGSNSIIGYDTNITGSAIIGSVTVADAGSIWTNLGDVFVGYYGNGTLIVTNGGRVYCAGRGGVGVYPGARGRVEVVGNGSRWDGAGSYVGLGVGDGTNGSMLVGAGATVAAVGQFYVYNGCTLELAGGTVQSGATPWLRLYGATTVFKGQGTVVGHCTNAGIFLPGGTNATGTLTFSNNFTLLSSSTSTFDFVSGACDQAIVQGNFTAGGELNLVFHNKAPGRYVIFDVAGTRSGAFSKTNWVGLTPGWRTTAGFEGNDYVVSNMPPRGAFFSIR